MKKNTTHHTYIPGIREAFKFMGESHEEYELPISSYKKLFGEYLTPDNYSSAINSIESINKEYLEKIYDSKKYPDIINHLISNVTPSFRYHGAPYNGWRLELSGRNIIYNIYKYFGLDTIPNIYNTSKHDEKVALEEDSTKELYKLLENDYLSKEQRTFLIDTINNINKITNINDTRLDDSLRGKYEYKDLLFVLGFVSLNNYSKTGNALYLNFAKKYYSMITKDNKPLEWPHWVIIDDTLRKGYEDFKKCYVEVMKDLTSKKKDDEKTPIKFADAFIKASSITEELENTDKIIEETKKDTKMSEEKKRRELEILKGLREKQEFYSQLKPTRMIYGKDELFGYIGFVFPTVTVFDKFYDGKRMIRPAKDNAIYWMKNDVIDSLVFQSKKEILEFIKSKENAEVGRIIHDKNSKYKAKVKELIKTKKDE